MARPTRQVKKAKIYALKLFAVGTNPCIPEFLVP